MSTDRRQLNQLRHATRTAQWQDVHRLRHELDQQIPLLDELTILINDRRRDAGQWCLRVAIERNMTGLGQIRRLADLLAGLDDEAARYDLAALLDQYGRLDARRVLGIPIPPQRGYVDGYPETRDQHQAQLRELGVLDAVVACERARVRLLANPPTG